MSLRVMARVWEHSAQEGSDLVLMLALANHANNDSVCWPKVRALATEARLQRRQIQALLGRLEAAGEIEIRRNTSGSHLASEYLVKAGDPAIRWPEEGRYGRVQSSVGTGAGDCTGLPKRVQSSAKTGAARNIPTGAVQHGRVQSSVGTGAVQRHALKESEPSIEPSIDSSSKNPTEVPAELSVFHSELKRAPGYQPSNGFFQKVLANYRGLDLEEEAIGMTSWFESPNPKFNGRTPRDAGRQCNSLFILGWLRRSLKRASEPEPITRREDANGSGNRFPQRCHF